MHSEEIISEIKISQKVAVHALIINAEGKMLVAHRTLQNDWKPNEIDIFGGSVEMGEDPEIAFNKIS